MTGSARAAAISVVLTLLLAPVAAEAQQPAKTVRIGFLSLASGPNPNMDVFRGLRELGWIEGQNLAVEYRWTAGKEDQLAMLASDLVRLKVDLIVTASTPAARAAKEATTTIPIVMTFVADPVESGLVASLARPGGNITGVSTFATGLIAKRLELLKAVVPGTTRVAILWQPAVFGERATRNMIEEAEHAGRALQVRLEFVEARRSDDLGQAFLKMRDARVNGLLLFPSPMLFEARAQVAAEAAKHRVPAMYPWREGAEAGGLMSYSTNFPEMYHRAAVYVDKILKGAKPADLPVEEPTRFDLVINLKTAKDLKLKVPDSVLRRADAVIR